MSDASGQRSILRILEKAAMPLIYLAAFLLHFLMTQSATLFNLTPDEFCVTAVAALANGYDWSEIVSLGGYYGYFQALFYIPVFRVTDEPYLRYRLMLVINGALMSLVPVIVYYISVKALSVKKPAALLFAAICGLYPSYMLLTKYAWNETMCCLMPWVVLLLLYKALSCESNAKKQLFSALGGLAAAAGYASHGRMIALAAAAAVVVPVMFWLRDKRRVFCFTGFYAALCAGLCGDALIKKALQNTLWQSGGSAPANTLETTLSRVFGLSGEGASIAELFDTLVGHFFYFVSSTWGFGAVCAAAVVTAAVLSVKKRVSRKGGETPDDDGITLLVWYALLSMGAIFAVSVLFKGTSPLLYARADTAIYGRYTEAFYPVAIFAALVLIYKGLYSKMQALAAAAVGAVTSVLTAVLVVPLIVECDRFVSAMVLGLAPMRYGEGTKTLLTEYSMIKIILSGMLPLLIWLAVMHAKRKRGGETLIFAAPLLALLVYSGVFGYFSYTLPQTKSAAKGAEYMSQALELCAGEYDRIEAVDLSRERLTKGQFLYPEITIIPSPAEGERPELVLGNREDMLSLWDSSLWQIGDINNSVCTFASSEAAAEAALAKGLKVSPRGCVRCTAAEIPCTESVEKRGASSTDLNLAESCEGVCAVVPDGGAVYTHYFNAKKTCRLFITIEGSGLDKGLAALTCDKGDSEMKYEILSASPEKLAISFVAEEGTENIRFKLSCGGGELSVYSLTISRAE